MIEHSPDSAGQSTGQATEQHRTSAEQPPDTAHTLDMMAAAAHFGISYDGVRRRIARGKLQAIHRDGRVYVVLPAPAPCTGQPAELRRTSPDIPPDTAPDSTGQGTEQPPDTAGQVAEHALAERDRLVTTLESEVAWLRDQLLAEQSARRREVSELHVLLHCSAPSSTRRRSSPRHQRPTLTRPWPHNAGAGGGGRGDDGG
jgi:hypothetical protein